MKRHGNLWPEVLAFENLVSAAWKEQRGKRYRRNVLEFNSGIEVELERIQADLDGLVASGRRSVRVINYRNSDGVMIMTRGVTTSSRLDRRLQTAFLPRSGQRQDNQTETRKWLIYF